MNNQEAKKLATKVLEKLSSKITKKDRLILGFSGGADSTFLLHFLKKTPTKELIVAHLNHSLRGKESDLDEKFALSQSGKNLTIITKKVDIKKLAKKEKIGLEEAGRKVRYEFFNELAQEYKAKYILTAHHADDNLETILLNFTRGASLKGLCGMEEVQETTEKIILYRPLLDLSKTEILAYLKTQKIRYREDKTNKDAAYRRNYIRHKVIPALIEINPSLPKTAAKNSKNIREISDFLEEKAVNWLKTHLKKESENEVNISRADFMKVHRALQQQIIRAVYRFLTGNNQNIETIHMEEVLKIIRENIGNKKKKLGKTTISLKNNIINCLKLPYNTK